MLLPKLEQVHEIELHLLFENNVQDNDFSVPLCECRNGIRSWVINVNVDGVKANHQSRIRKIKFGGYLTRHHIMNPILHELVTVGSV